MGLFGKSLTGLFVDEFGDDDLSKLIKDFEERTNQAMMIDPALFLQQHILPLGGLNHGNWATATQAYSNTSNVSHPAQQGALSAQSIQDALGAIAQQGALQSLINMPMVMAIDFEAPKKPIGHAGNKFGEFTGWRMWYVVRGELKSYSQKVFWKPKVPMTGKPSDHEHDGIWAFKDKRRAIVKAMESLNDYYHYGLNEYPGSLKEPVVVWGSVKLYGEVIEHEDGYRASIANIVSLEDTMGDVGDAVSKDKLLTDLRKAYLS